MNNGVRGLVALAMLLTAKKLKEEIKNAFVDENQEGIEGITAIGINGGLDMVLQIIEKYIEMEGENGK